MEVAPRGAQAVKTKTAVVGGGGAAALVLAIAAFVGPWEGLRLNPYKDIVGVWTVCYGETRGIERRAYTRAECEAMLTEGIGQFHAEVRKCIHKPLTQGQWVAVTSLAYNVGSPRVCGSTLVRKINAGAQAKDWCPELLRWNRAGGKVVRGLTNRRQAEYKVCIGG